MKNRRYDATGLQRSPWPHKFVPVAACAVTTVALFPASAAAETEPVAAFALLRTLWTRLSRYSIRENKDEGRKFWQKIGNASLQD